MTPPEETLSEALIRHQMELPAAQIALLERYCRLLWDWNEKLNLTRHSDFEKFVSRDLTDSLAFSRFLSAGERVLDVGSGGGVPGVVLAVLREDVQISLSESVGKRARVLADIVERMGLRVPVYQGRAEDLLTRERFDALTIRAVAPMKKLLEWFRPHWDAFDRMLVLKGPAWIKERGEARHYGLFHDLALRKRCSYPLPGTESESVLLEIRRKTAKPNPCARPRPPLESDR